MVRAPQILSLISRSAAYWAEVRRWLGAQIDLVGHPRELEFEEIPHAMICEESAAALGDNFRLDGPDHPWGWSQWVSDGQSGLIVLQTAVSSFSAVAASSLEFHIPSDTPPRELALAITLVAGNVELQRTRALERHRQERFAQFAYRDSLTGLPNRRAWRHYWRQAWRAEEREPAVCLAWLDIDYFKQLNTSFGHVTADQVLRRVGQTLRRDLRANDFAARLGGDEFGIVLNPLPTGSTIDVLHRIRRALRDQLIAARLPAVTASIGFTELPLSRDDSPRRAMRRAAEALRRAKNQQRNTVLGCDPRWPASCDSA